MGRTHTQTAIIVHNNFNWPVCHWTSKHVLLVLAPHTVYNEMRMNVTRSMAILANGAVMCCSIWHAGSNFFWGSLLYGDFIPLVLWALSICETILILMKGNQISEPRSKHDDIKCNWSTVKPTFKILQGPKYTDTMVWWLLLKLCVVLPTVPPDRVIVFINL